MINLRQNLGKSLVKKTPPEWAPSKSDGEGKHFQGELISYLVKYLWKNVRLAGKVEIPKGTHATHNCDYKKVLHRSYFSACDRRVSKK